MRVRLLVRNVRGSSSNSNSNWDSNAKDDSSNSSSKSDILVNEWPF